MYILSVFKNRFLRHLQTHPRAALATLQVGWEKTVVCNSAVFVLDWEKSNLWVTSRPPCLEFQTLDRCNNQSCEVVCLYFQLLQSFPFLTAAFILASIFLLKVLKPNRAVISLCWYGKLFLMVSQTDSRARGRNTLQLQSGTVQIIQFNPLVFSPYSLSVSFSSALNTHILSKQAHKHRLFSAVNFR